MRDARLGAGLSQAQLARRLGVSQAAVAKLERPGANPTVVTLQTTLRALGRELVITSQPVRGSVDKSLIATQLRLSPAQRLKQLEQMHAWARELQQAGAAARGDLA